MRTRTTLIAAALALNLMVLGFIAFTVSQDRRELLSKLAAQRIETEMLQKRFDAALSNATQASDLRAGELSAKLAGEYQELKAKLGVLETQKLAQMSESIAKLSEELGKTRSILTEVRQEAVTARADLAGILRRLAGANSALAEARKELAQNGAKVDRRVVEAEAFNLVDEKGQRLATLSSGEAGAALVVFDRQRRNIERLRLGAQSGGPTYGLVLKSAGDTPVSSLLVERDQAHLVLSENKLSGSRFDLAVNGKHPRMEVYNGQNQACLTLGIDSDGAYTDLYTADGSKCVSLGVGKEAWGLTVVDDQSRAGVMVNVVAHKPVLTTIDASGRLSQDTSNQK